MARFTLLKPTDQPPGTRRLLTDLGAALDDARYCDLKWIVAYAKSGPLIRLRGRLEAWKAAGKTSAAIIGIDQQGTSREALELALKLFDSVYTTQQSGLTFHPKIYYFKGPTEAMAFVGSNNLTVGGTEKNFEAGLLLEMDAAADASEIAEMEAAWNDLLPPRCPATELLDATGLADLVGRSVVVAEAGRRWNIGPAADAGLEQGGGRRRSGLAIMPESPLPARARRARSAGAAAGRAGTSASPVPVRPGPPVLPAVRGLAIQIRPHRNGEIFLSKLAVDENHAFFKWPFTGRTTPKLARNPSYPQLDPDPIVNVTVYGANPDPVVRLEKYALNTVYYEVKHEIRITASPITAVAPEYSVLLMEPSTTLGVDYEITVHMPASPAHAPWVAACNQKMPGGGRTPRRFGWF
ncbi:MAG TPA: phospholipase D family protein [Patescibacteria group bacterium]|nr:phospholipase D family protein [Patescibacteria group bacterium]